MRAIATLGLAIAAAACVPKQDLTAPTQPEVVVYTDGENFLPFSATIQAGEFVRFDITPAGDGTGHDVTFTPGANGAPENIPVTLTGKVDRTFLVKGVFKYVCNVHPGMIGQITVQ